MTPAEYAEAVAMAVRAEMVNQRRTTSELAAALGVAPGTARRRVDGAVPFGMADLFVTARWLGVPIQSLLPTQAADGASSLSLAGSKLGPEERV